MILTILLLTVKVKHIRTITPHRGSAPWCEYRGKHAVTHPGRMLLHLMLAAVWAAGVAAPEAVLAELVTTATEAAVAEACHAVAATVGTGDGMVDWDGGRSQSVSVTARWWWRWWWWCFYKDLCVCMCVYTMLHVGHTVHQWQPDQTLRGFRHNVQEHVERHPFLRVDNKERKLQQ